MDYRGNVSVTNLASALAGAHRFFLRTEKKYDGTSGVAAFVGLWFVPLLLMRL